MSLREIYSPYLSLRLIDFYSEGTKIEVITMMKNTRCLFQKRAKGKILKRLEGLRQRLVGTNEDALYMRDLMFEIQILRCKDCKVVVYHDGSWITEYCNQHSKENERL